MTLKASVKIGRPIAGRMHFAMVSMLALDGIDELMNRAPYAARLIVKLVRSLENRSGGVVVASRETMRELLQCSMPTVDRALKVLIDEGWVQRIRVGGASALAINHQVAWVGPRGDIQHAVFDATVIASRTEQDAIALNPPTMRPIPIVGPNEDPIPTGEGAEPPQQTRIAGLEPVAVAGRVDLDTGEVFTVVPPVDKKKLAKLDKEISKADAAKTKKATAAAKRRAKLV